MLKINLKFKDNLARKLKSKYGPNWGYDKSVIGSYSKEQLSAVYGFQYYEITSDINSELNPSFTINEVSYFNVINRAYNESINLYNSDTARKDFNGNKRNQKQIFETCLSGQIAEQYLIENYGFQDYDVLYHDLIKDGIITEVKTSTNKSYLDEQYIRIKNSNWNKSKRIIAYHINNNNIYELYFDKRI